MLLVLSLCNISYQSTGSLFKTALVASRRGVFKALSDIYDAAFFQKYLSAN